MMGFTSLLFECLPMAEPIELLDISYVPKHKIQSDDINILVFHQEKSNPYLIIMIYMCDLKHKT